MGIYLIADSTSTFSAVLGTLITVINVVLGLSFVIFVHELGHFLAAKLCGVKAEKFYIGFDVPQWKLLGIRMPSRIARVQWGETEYGIGIVPLGGYVKMLGQDDNPANAKKEAERIRQAGLEQNTQQVADDSSPGIHPRSFQAQTVPERMFIISAGIIMNIIFAALMAAVAFRVGVSYMTCDLAGSVPGSSAWRADIRPGTHTLQVGKNGKPQDYVRGDELREHALFAGLSSDDPEAVDLLVREPNGNTRWVGIAPRRLSDDAPPTLGVLFAQSNEVGIVLDHMSAGRAKPEIKVGDRLIAINGEKLDSRRENEKGQFVAWQVDEMLEDHLNQTVNWTLERRVGKETKTIHVAVPPQLLRTLGFHARIGPVTALREDSPAHQAGLKVGDILVSIDGKNIGDPLTLPVRFAKLGTRELTFQFWRRNEKSKEFERRELKVTPTTTEINSSYVGPDLSLEGIGLAYTVRNVVQRIDSDSLAISKLRPKDRITSLNFVAANDKVREQVEKDYGAKFFEEPLTLTSAQNWVPVHHLLQSMPPGVEVSLSVQRGNDELKVQLPPRQVAGQYYFERGVHFLQFEREFVSTTWGQAILSGIEETKDRLAHVAIVLKLLLTGRVSADNLGGPIRIAAFAGHEANLSISRLLMFLTFLSANLALLNALPVPVLDGGHFLFLTIELVRRRPVPEEWQQRLSFIGLAALLLLMFFVFFNDLRWLM